MSKAQPGLPTIIPRIFCDDPEKLVAFVKHVFGAAGDFNSSRPSDLCIGESRLLISGSEFRGRQTACLYVYVDRVDDVFKKAVDAGVKVIEMPALMEYGDRRCTVEDPWGNLWQIATKN